MCLHALFLQARSQLLKLYDDKVEAAVLEAEELQDDITDKVA